MSASISPEKAVVASWMPFSPQRFAAVAGVVRAVAQI
jgi:membrane protein YqaA with SNARE-associated domain